jgi:hypothetical protein
MLRSPATWYRCYRQAQLQHQTGCGATTQLTQYRVGTSQAFFSVVDPSGQTISCTTPVSIKETTSITLTCPTDLSLSVSGAGACTANVPSDFKSTAATPCTGSSEILPTTPTYAIGSHFATFSYRGYLTAPPLW